jgi:DNA-binding CsgD family transcriptional regulator
MREQSSFEPEAPSPVGGRAQGDGEVGRIEVGERTFIIALANEFGRPSPLKEMSRFQILGCDLVVLEATASGGDGAGAADDSGGRELASRLTGRELEIAVLVARGYATKNIAYRLQISEWTVATYLRRIFAKLGVYSRAQMVYRCAPLIDRIGEIWPPGPRNQQPPPRVAPAPDAEPDRHPADVVALSRKERDQPGAAQFPDAGKGRPLQVPGRRRTNRAYEQR